MNEIIFTNIWIKFYSQVRFVLAEIYLLLNNIKNDVCKKNPNRPIQKILKKFYKTIYNQRADWKFPFISLVSIHLDRVFAFSSAALVGHVALMRCVCVCM